MGHLFHRKILDKISPTWRNVGALINCSENCMKRFATDKNIEPSSHIPSRDRYCEKHGEILA
jgi:hypothetical protein